MQPCWHKLYYWGKLICSISKGVSKNYWWLLGNVCQLLQDVACLHLERLSPCTRLHSIAEVFASDPAMALAISEWLTWITSKWPTMLGRELKENGTPLAARLHGYCDILAATTGHTHQMYSSFISVWSNVYCFSVVDYNKHCFSRCTVSYTVKISNPYIPVVKVFFSEKLCLLYTSWKRGKKSASWMIVYCSYSKLNNVFPYWPEPHGQISSFLFVYLQ